MSSIDLSGKVAVVTGGSSGIGHAIATLLVERGAKVVIADIDQEHGEVLADSLGAAAEFAVTDVAQPDQIERTVETAVTKFGGLHVMVNNAGVPGTQQPDLLEDDFSDFEQVMAVNLLGVMVGTKLAARHMATHGGGSIINTSSIGGVQAGPGVMSYRAAKAAVIHFSKSAAMALAAHDIRVNCIAPGHIPTPLLEASAARLPEAERVAYVQATRDRMRSMRPLQRDGSGRDVAEVVAFLAADASAYVTGTVLPVDGGAVAGIVAPPQYGGQSR